MLTPSRPPPEDYYQNNCRSLFQHLLEHADDLFDAHELKQVHAFFRLGDDAQRLFARLLTRKGQTVRVDSLDYAEVTDEPGAIVELERAGLVQINAHVNADLLLTRLTRQELADLIALDKRQAGKLKKPGLVAMVLSGRSDRRVCQLVAAQHPYLSIVNPHVWQLCLILYFGESGQDWTTFVRRDLGQMRFERLPLDSRQFNNRSALARAMHYRRLSALSHRVTECPGLGLALAKELSQVPTDRWLQRRRDRSLLRVARIMEQQGTEQDALDVYSMVERHPARERRVRIHTKLGQTAAAETLLEQVRAQPYNLEETQFAARFGRRGAGYQPPQDTLEIPAPQDDTSIELTAAELLVREHRAAFAVHTENRLARTLTGLMFWSMIFAPVKGAFTNPFQIAPHDLWYEEFVLERAACLAKIEALVVDAASLETQFKSVLTEKRGIANPLVDWNLLDTLSLDVLLKAVPWQDIQRLCGFMIRNLSQFRSGFPDLFVVYLDGHYEFVEVKGPGDQLQPGQRVWFQAFANLQLPARVLRLKVKDRG